MWQVQQELEVFSEDIPHTFNDIKDPEVFLFIILTVFSTGDIMNGFT